MARIGMPVELAARHPDIRSSQESIAFGRELVTPSLRIVCTKEDEAVVAKLAHRLTRG